MTTLTVAVLEARPSPECGAPGITFRLRIGAAEGAAVHALVLRSQVRIEPRGRCYTREEEARLYELFGDVSQWDRTLRGFTWTHAALATRSFSGSLDVDLPIACTYDLEVAASKYLHAVRGGEIPLVFLFTGTIFAVRDGRFAVEPIAWDLEARFQMPARVWGEAMDRFFPGEGWLRVRWDTLDRLVAFRGREALVTWDDTIDRLLDGAVQPSPLRADANEVSS